MTPRLARDNPYPFYDWLRKEQPVYREPRTGIYYLSRYSDVLAAARDHANYSSAFGIGPAYRRGRTMISTDPPEHTRLRKLVTPAFVPGVIERLMPRAMAIVNELLEEAITKPSFDLVLDIAQPFPLIVIAELLGIDPARRNDFRRWSTALLNYFSYPTDRTHSVNYAKELPAFLACVNEVVEQRRHAPADDLITLLIQSRDDADALKPAEIVHFVELVLTAGNETTANLIGNAALTLATHPDERERLLSNPQLLSSAIEESARFESPIQAFLRTVTADVVIHSKRIPRGSKVALLWGAANRDPEAFSEPDRFDIGRTPNLHLAFGSGIHYCIGAPLARLEMRAIAAVFRERVKEIEFDLATPLQWRTDPQLRGLASLPVTRFCLH